jgi:heme/copper-type cytochrome/quinol oxidase subunit 2
MRSPVRAGPTVPVLLVGLTLTGCAGGEPTPAGERPLVVAPDNPSVASAVADPTAPRLVTVVVADGRTTGDTGVVAVKRHVPVRLVVVSDVTDTLHVRGYDLRQVVTAGSPVQLDFLADRSGNFPVVLEESGTELTLLRVA